MLLLRNMLSKGVADPLAHLMIFGLTIAEGVSVGVICNRYALPTVLLELLSRSV